MVSNSAEERSFLLAICTLALESTTNSLTSGSLAEALGRTHFSAGEKNVALSFTLSLYICLARSQALLWAHRSCLSVSSWDQSSNFYNVGTSLMSRFDFYFSKRWSFLVPDTRVTQRVLSESNSSNCVQLLSFLDKRVHPSPVIHNPIVIHFSQLPQHSCRRFLFSLGCCSFSAFLFGCSSTL